MIIKKLDKLKNNTKGSAVIVSLIVLSLIVIVVVSISTIYINKIHSLKNINDYYDKQIIRKLESR